MAGSYIYFKHQQNNAGSAIDAVPVNTAAIIEFKDIPGLLKKTQANKVFADISEIGHAADFAMNLSALDSLLKNDAEFAEMFRGLPLVVSFHNTNMSNYEPLAVMAFSSNLHGRRALEAITRRIEPLGKISYTKYNDAKICKLEHQNGKTQIFMTFHQGYLIASTNEMLLQESVRQTESGYGMNQNPPFVKVRQWSGKNVDANVYLQFKFLNPYIQKQFVNNLFSDMAIQSLSDWGGFDLTLKDNIWMVNGFTLQNAVKNQWSQLFDGQEAVSSDLIKKVPMDVNGFTWLGISNFQKYQRSLESYMESVGQLNRHQTNQNSVKEKFGNLMLNQMADNFSHGIMLIAMPDGSSVCAIETKGSYEAGHLLDLFVKGRAESPKVQTFKIDNDTRFDIYEMSLTQVPARVFGPWFGHCKAQFVCQIDNALVFGDTYAVLSRFLYDNVLHKKLQYDPDFDQFSNYITNKSNFCSFVSLNGAETLLSRILSSENITCYHNNQAEFSNFYGLIWQFSSENGFLYHNTFLRHQPTHSNAASTLWETHLDTLAAFKPGVQQIDYYRNGKLQMFFNTATKMYLVDRNGNHVERYPIALPSPTHLPVSVFDYTKTKNYRLFVECANADIHVYSIDGKTLPDFSLQRANHVPTAPAQHFINGGKDYISITDAERVCLIDRRGNMLVDYSERINPSVNNNLTLIGQGKSDPSLVLTSADGTLCFLHFDGTITQRKVGDFSPKHFFDIEDICGDATPELIFADSNMLSVFTFDGEKIFERKFGEPITQRPAASRVSSTQQAIVLT